MVCIMCSCMHSVDTDDTHFYTHIYTCISMPILTVSMRNTRYTLAIGNNCDQPQHVANQKIIQNNSLYYSTPVLTLHPPPLTAPTTTTAHCNAAAPHATTATNRLK